MTTKTWADTKSHANAITDTKYLIDENREHSQSDCTDGLCHPVIYVTPRITAGMNVAFPCSIRKALGHNRGVYRSVLKTNVVVVLALEVTPPNLTASV